VSLGIGHHEIAAEFRGRGAWLWRSRHFDCTIPLPPKLAAVLEKHGQRLLERQAPGLGRGLVFPSV